MSNYNKINYTDVVNQVRQNGWEIESQTPYSTIISKKRGAPGALAIPLALIPVIGVLLALAWIAVRGTITVTIERKLTLARVHTPTSVIDVNTREDLDLFFSDHRYAGSVGYYAVILTGGVMIFVVALLFQFAIA
jgi:hypothetical protein